MDNSKMMEQMMSMMMMMMMQNMQNQGNQNNYQPQPVEKVEKVEEVSEKPKQRVNAAVACTTSSVKCNWSIEVIKDGKRNFYRITDGIFTAGKWRTSKYDANKEYRIPTNQEAHKLALQKIKALPLIQSIQPNGAEWFAYGFYSKKAAEEALNKLPEKIDRAEIAAYISEHGPIKAKAITRIKTA